jgi:PAS domain S-box-containing protein
MYFRALRIRTSLLLLAVIAVVPGFALLLHAASEQRDARFADVKSGLEQLASNAADQFTAAFEHAHGVVSVLGRVVALDAKGREACSRAARQIVAEEPGYANVGMADENGIVICSAVESRIGLSVADRGYFQRAMRADHVVVGEYVIGRITGHPVLLVAHPVFEGTRRVGVAFAAIHLAHLDAVLAATGVEEPQVLTVIDGGGTIVARHPDPDRLAGSRGRAPIIDRMAAAGRGFAELTGVDGVVRMYAFVPVRAAGRPTDVVVSAGIPRAAALAGTNALFARSLAYYAVTALVVLLAAWALGEFALGARLRKLAEASRRLTRGELGARSGIAHGRDDIGALARAFDEMAVGIESLTRQNALILESVGIGIFGVNRGGVVTFANPAAGQLLGEAPAALVGHNIADHVGAADPGGGASGGPPVLAALEDGGIHRLDRAVLRACDGRTFPADVVVTPIRHDGQVIGAVLTFRDVGEQVQLEQQLRQSQKLEAIGRLAGGVAHDFNNLLSVMLSAGRYLVEGLPADSPLRAEAQEVVAAGQRAAALTRQLLAFSRKQALQHTTLAPNEIVTSMRSLLARTLGEDVELALSLGAEGRIRGDPGQLEQVILNLAVNARDAMERGGRLTIETRDVLLDGETAPGRLGAAPGAYVVIAVTDTGCGMSDDVLSRVFEPFFTTKDVNRGTGLGLSVVWGIVHQLGGTIHVRSARGDGATFEIYLPIVADERHAPAPDVGSTEADDLDGTESILFVEDDDMVREVGARILRRAGYDVLVSSGAAEAIRLVQEGRKVDALVTDVVMPQISGPELAAWVVGVVPSIRILFMSGYSGASLAHQKALESNLEFLEKPFTAEALLRAVRAVMRGPPAREVAFARAGRAGSV